MEEATVRGGFAALLLALLALLTTATAAQRGSDGPANAPENCPYCHGDRALMASGGLVSHGPFPFAKSDTQGIDTLLPALDIHWIESAHFRIGIALATYKPKQSERKKIRAELELLAQTFEEVNPKAKVIDPWLRAHLYAQRMEGVWDRWLEIMQVQESDFPGAGNQWILGTEYWGEGPYVGQAEKYEILVLPTAPHQVAFLRDQFGLSHAITQRWNVLERGALTVTTNLLENDLRDDEALHGHLAFNISINMLDGFKNYSYDTPRWISEGLGHFVERELNPKYNSFDASEGYAGIRKNKSDWETPVKKLVQSGKAPRLAELVALRTYAEFTLDHHYTTWSMTVFMITEMPDQYACLNGGLHGIKAPDGQPDGSNMREKHRKMFQECFGMSYAEFDAAWRQWVAGM